VGLCYDPRNTEINGCPYLLPRNKRWLSLFALFAPSPGWATATVASTRGNRDCKREFAMVGGAPVLLVPSIDMAEEP